MARIVGGFMHPRLRWDLPLSVGEDELQDGPDKVIVDEEAWLAFWLQPDRPTGYGNHGDPGDLIVAPVDGDGYFRLSGICSAYSEVDDTYYDHPLPHPDYVADIEEELRLGDG